MDNELLLAIANLLQPIREDLQEVKRDLAELKQEFSEVKHVVEQLKRNVEKLEQNVEKLNNEMAEANKRITVVEKRIHTQEIQNENEILPRLRTIEKCYTDTYYRYQDNVEGYDQMKSDIKVIRDVVLDHSRKLQNLPQFA